MATVWGFFHDSFATLEHIFLSVLFFSTFIIIFDLKKKPKRMNVNDKNNDSDREILFVSWHFSSSSRDAFTGWEKMGFYFSRPRRNKTSSSRRGKNKKSLRKKVDSESPKQAVHSRWVDAAWNNLCVYLEGQKRGKERKAKGAKVSRVRHNTALWKQASWNCGTVAVAGTILSTSWSEKSEGEREEWNEKGRDHSQP